MIMIEQCEKCKHKEILNGGIVGCPYMDADCRKGEMFEPYTNADRIRAMSDEELAELFVSAVCVCPRGKNPDLCYCDLTCLECVSEWLQQPAEEVHHE
jgi:hypothetical protein